MFPALPQTSLGEVELLWLADRPQLAATFAAWHHAHWAELMPDWSASEACSELEDHATRRAFPTTWIAVAGEEPVGSVSLVVSDANQFLHLSPWLSSLYVHPAWRGRGLGEALIGRLLFAARRWGFPHVHLFTAGRTSMYQRLGFVPREQRDLLGTPVQILTRTL